MSDKDRIYVFLVVYCLCETKYGFERPYIVVYIINATPPICIGKRAITEMLVIFIEVFKVVDDAKQSIRIF
ncbi:hypothetical protein SG26_16265 [Haloarcula sp. CBA1115]|nr:hypothetical protein SG26_16265 [Haloarcula sp. CBA1115]